MITPTPPLFLTKLNNVSYPYWSAGYPYTNLKYSGNITQWVYTFDYSTFYSYSSGVDYYINPNDLSRTYIYVDLAGYSTSQVSIYKYEGGVRTKIYLPQVYSSGNIRAYLITNSKNIGAFDVETFIQATDGTAILGNGVSINRNAH